MIEGLHADVGGNELRELLEVAAEKSAVRAEGWRETAAELRAKAVVAAEEPAAVMPWHAPARWAKAAERKVRYLRFLAEHLDRTERYRLSGSDLAEIGVLG